MEHFPDVQLATSLSLALWALLSACLLALSFRLRQLLYINVLWVLLSGSGLAICYSLEALNLLLVLTFCVALSYVGLAYGILRTALFKISPTESTAITIKNLPENFPRESLLPALLERSNRGIYIFDLCTQANIFINAQYTHITGYSLKDLNRLQKQSGLMHVFHPDDVDAVERHIQEVVSSPMSEYSEIQYRFRHRDGRWIHCLSHDVMVRDEGGEDRFMIGTFVDVSQLYKERAEFRSLSSRYSATFEDAPVGIAHVSQQGKFLRANSTLKALLGYSDSELANLTFMDITHPDDLEKDLNLLNSLIEGDIPNYKMEKRYFNAQNKIIWIELTVAVVRKTNGDVDYFISIISDITHNRLIARDLKEVNAAFKRVVNSSPFLLAHPIDAIGSMAARIENKIIQRGGEKELLFINDIATISRVSSEMSSRLENLLDLVRFNVHSTTIAPVSLEGLIKRSRGQVGLNSAYPVCRVSCEGDAIIPVDDVSFVKLITNLCLNIEQMRKLPGHEIREVRVSCYPEDWHEQIVLEFKCGGFELTPEFQQLMLRAFDYLDENQLDEVGVRFAIIRQIVRAHNGKLELDCSTPTGFALTVTLPAGTTLPY